MAKAKQSKTAMIYEILDSEGEGASPKEIATRLTKKGIKMSPGYVSTIKTNWLKNKQIGRGLKKAGAKIRQTIRGGPGSVSVSDLNAFATLVKKIGGIPTAKLILDALDVE